MVTPLFSVLQTATDDAKENEAGIEHRFRERNVIAQYIQKAIRTKDGNKGSTQVANESHND